MIHWKCLNAYHRNYVEDIMFQQNIKSGEKKDNSAISKLRSTIDIALNGPQLAASKKRGQQLCKVSYVN